MEIIIDDLKEEEFLNAAQLLTEAMCSNPNHIAIFKSSNPDALEKQRKMFLMILNDPHNQFYAAKLNGELVGVMAYTNSAHCQLKPLQFLVMLGKFIRIFGMHLFPVLRWRMVWAKHDYAKPHVHFGPIAVAPAHQGKGIGKALLTHFSTYLEKSQQIGYLETDKIENVNLYERFGFEVIATDKVLTIPNWFMLRKVQRENSL